MNTFFVCPRCGNDKEFNIFTSNFQAIKQSPELGRRVDESDVLPSLTQVQQIRHKKGLKMGKKRVCKSRKSLILLDL